MLQWQKVLNHGVSKQRYYERPAATAIKYVQHILKKKLHNTFGG
jgi:hypothetical protein